MELAAALLAAAAAFVLVYALATPNRQAVELLQRLNRHERSLDPERAAMLAQPFTVRAVGPLARRVRRTAAAVLPTSLLDSAERKLILAGEPITLHVFVLFQAAAGAASLFAAIAILARDLPAGATVAGLAGCALGAAAPALWLRWRIRQRQARILKELPDAVDLIVTLVEAGMAIDGALAEVASETQGPLGEELGIAVRETTLGRSRRDALLGVIERTQVPELRAFIHSLIQAEQTGVPVGQVLRSQAAHVRLQRRQRAEAQAQRAPVKMVIVLVTLVLPAMLLLVVGPALLRMADRL
ncbi:hypothetical protein HRbin29_00843 [bacterium HR29]|jgi:tight adherence protein C|nr:hypothetical protein HRbin29_00843 [bacterium HR29]